MAGKNETKVLNNDKTPGSVEAAKTLADLAKEVLKFGKSSVEITIADQQSSSEYNTSLSNTLNAINKEISESNDPEEKSVLYKQREDLLNRMREEKENQRLFNNEREEKDREQGIGLFKIVTVVALGGAGAVATKLFLDQRKS